MELDKTARRSNRVRAVKGFSLIRYAFPEDQPRPAFKGSGDRCVRGADRHVPLSYLEKVSCLRNRWQLLDALIPMRCAARNAGHVLNFKELEIAI